MLENATLAHQGRFKEMLIAMGTDLDEVNALSVECPSALTIALYDKGYTTPKIKEKLEELSVGAKMELSNFERAIHYALADRVNNLEETIERCSTLDSNRKKVIEFSSKFNLPYLLDYAESLSDEQAEILAQLPISSFFQFVDNDKETLTIFRDITDMEKFKPYLTNPTHAGAIIRSYKGLPDDNYTLFYEETGIEILEKSKQFKPFVDKYAKMDVEERGEIRGYLSSLELKLVMDLSEKLDNNKLLLACEMMKEGYAKEVTIAFLEDENLTERLNSVQQRYRRSWLNFLPKCEREAFLELPLMDFYRSADVLDYIRGQRGGEVKFFEAFNVVLAKGEVGPWTKDILKQLQSAGKGGTNYRVLEVAA